MMENQRKNFFIKKTEIYNPKVFIYANNVHNYDDDFICTNFISLFKNKKIK